VGSTLRSDKLQGIQAKANKMPFFQFKYFSKGSNLGGAEVCVFLKNGIHFGYFSKA